MMSCFVYDSIYINICDSEERKDQREIINVVQLGRTMTPLVPEDALPDDIDRCSTKFNSLAIIPKST